MKNKLIKFLAVIGAIVLIIFGARLFLAKSGIKYSPPDLSRYNTTPLSEQPAENPSTQQLPSNIILDVPFQPQAPFGNWADPEEENGCEEASMIMASYAVQKKTLSPDQMLHEIQLLADYEMKIAGTFYDTSAEDTAKIYNLYFLNSGKAEVKYDTTVRDIKNELAHGHIVLIPTNGQLLDNPFYKQPGPDRHMLVLRGYDDKKGLFITNDAGTKRGQGYEYPYDVVLRADLHYPTGREVPPTDGRKVMIVINND